MKERRLLKKEEGSIVAIALIMLIAVTLLGIAATTTSTIELKIAANDKIHKRTFYAAEAGIEHVRESLRNALAANVLPGQQTRWNFALADATDTDSDGLGSFSEGVLWIPDGAVEGCTYQVTIWNNADSGDANTDTDGVIFARAVATGPGAARSEIEVSLLGTGTGGGGSGYSGQEGGGSGKSYTSNDLEAIKDFSQQL
jgi:Tfp pilus assembly protein PilX